MGTRSTLVEHRTTDAAQKSLSIVVIGRNEGQRLASCLDSIRAVRDFEKIQLIYVDSASTDGSPELASRYGAEVIVIHPERPTAASGRNAGWRRATEKFILFLDGDTILHPDFPLAAFEAMATDSRICAVWGHRREIRPNQSIYTRVLDLDWVYRPGIMEACGGDVLMRRSVLMEVGGFDDQLIAGEEPELCQRMRAQGNSILHIDHPMTRHDLHVTRWSQYWKHAVRAGYAYAQISDRFRSAEDRFWLADARRGIILGCFWPATFVVAALACIHYGYLPIALWLGLALIASVRSAWKARWKCDNRITLFLYGVHSHLQHIPILFGQLQYVLDKRAKRQRQLIEYKRKEAR
jgi:glycosyltransferase involved in cell wall biosynthesis